MGPTSSAIAVWLILIGLTTITTGVLSQTLDCKPIQVIPENGTQPLIVTCDPATGTLLTSQKTTTGQLFCLDTDTLKVLLGPNADVVACECPVKVAEARQANANPDYVPQCNETTGEYTEQQCSRNGNCWCSDTAGGQLGPKWNSKETVIDLSTGKARGLARMPCDLLRRVFSPTHQKKA